jgi:ectoine hydroxylase-related dioxygenase (phytanoyl-CoA dioxygenase family)
MPTETALPELSEEYRLAEEQVRSFRKNGHVLLRGVASPEEVAAYRPVLTGAAERFNTENRSLEERDTYGRAFLQIMNLWTRDEAVRRFVLARRFGKIAADLLGVDGVRLYHDQALYKEAQGGPTPWHQDQYYWPLDTNQTITMWMPLVDASAEMGTMTFAGGSHRTGFLGHLEISDESEAEFDRLVSERGFPRHSCGAMRAGDATFHYGWTLHSAPGNATDRTREVMTIIYFANGTRILPPDNPHRQNDLDTWLPGQKPGEVAASPLNPLVYSRASG